MYDLIINNVKLVRPNKQGIEVADIAIANGKIEMVAPAIEKGLAKKIFEGKNYLAFPGLVDAHMHTGIYNPLAEDAVTESKAAAMDCSSSCHISSHFF